MSIKERIKKVIEPIFNIRNKSYLETYYKNLDTNKEIYNIDNDISSFKKVLVLAPHQDDETIGLGATISKMKSLGVEVDLVYLTDGRINGDNTNISEIRIEESNKMKNILSIDNMYVVDNINDTLENKIEYTSEYMANNLKLDEYDAYFFTSRFDCHKDHRATFDTVVNLCKNNKLKKDAILYSYDINNSIQGDALNCISMIKNGDLSNKWKAYEVFKSQKYITFSTIKIIDNKKLGIAISKGIETSEFSALECFCRMNEEQLIKVSKTDNSFAKDMNTATSSIKLKRFLEENKKYKDKFKNIQGLYK